jgi:hypothetical protein
MSVTTARTMKHGPSRTTVIGRGLIVVFFFKEERGRGEKKPVFLRELKVPAL